MLVVGGAFYEPACNPSHARVSGAHKTAFQPNPTPHPTLTYTHTSPQLWVKGKPGQVARPGSVWVLEGEGMPIHGDPNAHGRLFVKFAVEFPPALALTCVCWHCFWCLFWICACVYIPKGRIAPLTPPPTDDRRCLIEPPPQKKTPTHPKTKTPMSNNHHKQLPPPPPASKTPTHTQHSRQTHTIGRRRWRPFGSSCPSPPPSRARPTPRTRRR